MKAIMITALSAVAAMTSLAVYFGLTATSVVGVLLLTVLAAVGVSIPWE